MTAQRRGQNGANTEGNMFQTIPTKWTLIQSGMLKVKMLLIMIPKAISKKNTQEI